MRSRLNRSTTAPASRRRRSDDRASMHVLEATIIAAIMVSAVAYVAMFDVPPPAAKTPRDILQQKAEDALSILYDTPMDSNLGDNAMSVYLLQCMQGNCTNLTARLNNLLPEGAAYAVYISNGYETFPVYVTREPTGEALTATRLFEPKWSHTFIQPALNFVNGTSDPLMMYSFPMFNSNPVSQGGSPLLVLVHGNTTDDHADYILSAFTSTVAHNATDPTAVAASLFFVNDSGSPIASIDVLNQTIEAVGGDPTGANVTFRLRLLETANITIPEGVQLDVQMPRGWTATANESLQGGNWSVLENATDPSAAYNGSHIRAQLARSVRNTSVDFVFNATYVGDSLNFYPFRAQLSRGVQSVAELLVRSDNESLALSPATPIITTSAPRPMGGGAPTVWTMAVYAPADDPNDTQNLSAGGGTIARTINVDRIQIVEQDGARIFGDVHGLENGTGTWEHTGDRLTWRGNFTLTAHTPLNLTFLVNASGVAGAPPDASPFVAPVVFDSWSGRLATQSAPGLYRGLFMPRDENYGGYNNDDGDATAGQLYKEHIAIGDSTYRTTHLPGRATYNVSSIESLADALYGSYVSVERRAVPVGGEVVLSANVQSTLFALAKAGQEAGVTLRFYPPWSGDTREPVYEKTNLDQGLLTGDITQMVLVDVNEDGYPDPVIGTANGRVLAVHALTGDRLAGDVWTAPLTAQAKSLKLSSKIVALDTIVLYNETYIVVGTDENSDGIFVLNLDLDQVWSPPILQGTVTSLDTSVAIDPYDGERDILVGMTHNDDGWLYVLRAIPGQTTLQPHSPKDLAGMFYISPGKPQALLGLPSVGPYGGKPGLAATVQTLVDGVVQLYVNPDEPQSTSAEFVPLSTPRAGLVAVNRDGDMTSTMFGAPMTLARSYDYNRDDITDVLGAGPSGYVVMLNGSALTQPLYSYVMVGAEVIDADTRSAAESYLLGADGAIMYTDDAWITSYSATYEYPVLGAVAIDSNETNSMWAVGPSNALWRSVGYPLPATTENEDYLPGVRMDPIPPTLIRATRAGVDYDFTGNVTDFTDLWFEGANGWVVGETCATCTEILVMRTTDGGATWTLANRVDGTLANGTQPVRDNPTRVQFYNGVGWITGENGLLLRSLDGSAWSRIETNVRATLRDISCNPEEPRYCAAVGDGATLIGIYDAHNPDPALVQVVPHEIQLTRTLDTAPDEVQAQVSDQLDRDFTSIGIVNTSRAYIGSKNMVLATFDAARSWTTLPMNYIENNATTVNVNPDGTGYIYGGGPSNGRIWFLHDYHTQSFTYTKSYADRLPAGAKIESVEILESNVSIGASEVWIDVASNGDDWTSMGPLSPPPFSDPVAWLLDSRNYTAATASFDSATSGSDFRVRFNMTTAGDRTITSPYIREMTFVVKHTQGENRISIDVGNLAEYDAANSTGWWDPDIGAIHMPYVREFWARNVSGEVLDLRTGYDVTDDGFDDVWIGTGDVLAANSPDYIIYAGSDENKALHPDNRVYLLDGRWGTPIAKTPSFDGNVTHLRLADANGDGAPEYLFVTTYDTTKGGNMYALYPRNLTQAWHVDLGDMDEPRDLEVGQVRGGHADALVVTDAVKVDAAGHVWALNATDGDHIWRTMPEDMGRYHINQKIPSNWLFGAYLVEVEVEWEAGVTQTGVSDTVLRSARFYDYFMVTPHDALASPSPVYNVHLVTWFPDWG